MNTHLNCAGCLSRRGLLVAGAAGAAVALAGCSTYGDEPPRPAETAPEASPGGASAGTGGATGGGEGGGAAAIATLADVPVGGAKIVGDVVLTQPVAGTIAAFSATCTHAGCAVNRIENGRITCPCHGSAFNLDGTVANGPAARPLSAVKVAVTDQDITLG